MEVEKEPIWLLLTQYAQKYNISISTLRRRIRQNKIQYKLMDGRYFIVDNPPLGMIPKHQESSSLGSEGLSELLTFCQELIEGKERLYQNLLKEKAQEMSSLQERISEQKMLIKILEEKISRMTTA